MQFCLKVVNIIRNLVIELLPTLSSGLDNILVQKEQEKIVVPLYNTVLGLHTSYMSL